MTNRSYHWPDPDAMLPEGLDDKRASGKRVRRNLDTPESREWWDSAERIAATMRDWPESRKVRQ